MIKARMQVENPDDFDITLRITMPLKRWQELRAQLDQQYPSWAFGAVITRAVTLVEETHVVEQDVSGV